MKKLFSSLLIVTLLFGYSSINAIGNLTINNSSTNGMSLSQVLGSSGDNVIADATAATSSATLYMSSKTAPISTFDFSDKGITTGQNFLNNFTDKTSTDGDSTTKSKKEEIATITINNNTRDGFKLEVLSANHLTNGELKLVATDIDRTHGEEDIPYSLSAEMTAEGIVDNAAYADVNTYSSETTMTFTAGVCTLIDAGSTAVGSEGGPVNTPLQNLEVSIKMSITNNGLTAGNYQDTLTYRYTDL